MKEISERDKQLGKMVGGKKKWEYFHGRKMERCAPGQKKKGSETGVSDPFDYNTELMSKGGSSYCDKRIVPPGYPIWNCCNIAGICSTAMGGYQCGHMENIHFVSKTGQNMRLTAFPG